MVIEIIRVAYQIWYILPGFNSRDMWTTFILRNNELFVYVLTVRHSFILRQVFQRLVNGSQDFLLNWNHYREGFGNVNHEFWLGNDKIYSLTNQKTYELRIDFVNRDGAPHYAKFDFFRINDETDNYRLSGVGSYSGTAGVY